MLGFGFKTVRFRQWLDVVDEEQRVLHWRDKLAMLWKIAMAGTRLGSVSRKAWRDKMRCCPKCPIFDRSLHRCRPFTGSDLGCGCFVPFLALADKKCFADGLEEFKQFGWNAKKDLTH